MKIKLNVDLLKYKKGSFIEIDRLKHNEQIYFNKRIRDSKIDNCVEIITHVTKSKVKKDENINKKEM